MSIDYIALWSLVILNTFAILLIVRQLAMLPQFARRPGPKAGSVVPDWSLTALDGRAVHASAMPGPYTLLFIASTCGPCHSLLGELRKVGRPQGLILAVAQGDADALAREAAGPSGALFDDVLLGGTGDLSRDLAIPGTPYAVAIASSRVVAAGVAPTAQDLSRVTRSAVAAEQAGPRPA